MIIKNRKESATYYYLMKSEGHGYANFNLHIQTCFKI